MDHLQADSTYTVVAWRNDEGVASEAVVSLPRKDLLAPLDPEQFVQVHRSVIVNFASISQVVRGLNETAEIHLKRRNEVLRVSRSFTHHFRQMQSAPAQLAALPARFSTWRNSGRHPAGRGPPWPRR